MELKRQMYRLTPERLARVRQALRIALDELLFLDRPPVFSMKSLLDLIDPSLHDDVHQYLQEVSIAVWDESDACRILVELLEAGIGADLTDDQEAHLAVLRNATSGQLQI